FVPVTPTRCNPFAGCRRKFAATAASTRLCAPACISAKLISTGTAPSGGASLAIATAPRFSASGTYLFPSSFSPLSAKKRAPRFTFRLSYATELISGSPEPEIAAISVPKNKSFTFIECSTNGPAVPPLRLFKFTLPRTRQKCDCPQPSIVASRRSRRLARPKSNDYLCSGQNFRSRVRILLHRHAVPHQHRHQTQPRSPPARSCPSASARSPPAPPQSPPSWTPAPSPNSLRPQPLSPPSASARA